MFEDLGHRCRAKDGTTTFLGVFYFLLSFSLSPISKIFVLCFFPKTLFQRGRKAGRGGGVGVGVLAALPEVTLDPNWRSEGSVVKRCQEHFGVKGFRVWER